MFGGTSETKEKIAIASIDIFAKNGIKKSSLEEIARAANVPVDVLAQKFKTKEDIVVQIWSYVEDLLDAKRGESFASTTSYKEKMHMFFYLFDLESKVEHIEQLVKIFALYLALILEDESVLLRRNFKEQAYDDAFVIKTLLDEGVKVGEFKPVDTLLVAKMIYSLRLGVLVACVAGELPTKQMQEGFHNQLDYLLKTLKT